MLSDASPLGQSRGVGVARRLDHQPCRVGLFNVVEDGDTDNASGVVFAGGDLEIDYRERNSGRCER